MWTFVTAIQELTIDKNGATYVRTAYIFEGVADQFLTAKWLNENGQKDRTYTTIDLIVWK